MSSLLSQTNEVYKAVLISLKKDGYGETEHREGRIKQRLEEVVWSFDSTIKGESHRPIKQCVFFR